MNIERINQELYLVIEKTLTNNNKLSEINNRLRADAEGSDCQEKREEECSSGLIEEIAEKLIALDSIINKQAGELAKLESIVLEINHVFIDAKN